MIRVFCSCLYTEGMGNTFIKGGLCPAFRQMGEGYEKVFLCLLFFSCFQLKIILLPKWHNLGWHILIRLFTPGRNLINVRREDFHQNSNLREHQKTHRYLNMNVMIVENLSSRHQVLHYLTELTHMEHRVKVVELEMPSARNHNFRPSEKSPGRNPKDEDSRENYTSGSRKDCRTQRRGHNL